jgi:flavin reductase (DIM6/NTAB) family NADH-FMN oxidoreductase RutF
MYSWTPDNDNQSASIDNRQLRNALGAFPTGVCLVTTIDKEGKREGMTINSFSSVSLTPPLILWSIRNDARSASTFIHEPHFNLSVLADSQHELAMHFARAAADKFSTHEDHFEIGHNKCPKLLNSVATYECSVYSRHQEGDHMILIGKVNHFSSSNLPPLFFHKGKMGSIQELADLQLQVTT